MSWKKIKTFLILLFLIINLYLIISTSGSVVRFNSVTIVDSDTLKKTASVVSSNYNITFEQSKVPLKIHNLNIIDVTNYIYTDHSLADEKYKLSFERNVFRFVVNTNTYSYNEDNARAELEVVISNLGIKKEDYTLTFKKSDNGLVGTAVGVVSGVPILNSRIKAEFDTKKITVSGTWYLPNTIDIKSKDNTLRMADITGVLIDAADRSPRGQTSSFSEITYGYYVSSYDENAVTKISSAIPCYMIQTNNGLTYFYDALNGKFLKQEE